MHIGLSGDHGGFGLKVELAALLAAEGHEVTDFGPSSLASGDDYPDYVIPMAEAVARGKIERGIAVCGSGVGACIAANKVAGVRAALVHDTFSAHQGVEDDDMNVICLGGRVVATAFAWELVRSFLSARFKGAERFIRRIDKIGQLEIKEQAR
jgi:ribose 5-phosphate isomerase B